MLDRFRKRFISFVTAAVMTISCGSPVFAEESDISEAEPETAASETQGETELTHMTFELYPDEQSDEKTVTLEGLMPESAEATAIDVTDRHEGIVAYDITIKDRWSDYQPDKENPIRVEIVDPVIKEDIQLWHIHDDGTRERILDFQAEEGRLSFFATGFSVYEVVDGDRTPFVPGSATTVEQLTSDEAANGFYLSYNNSGYQYFTNTVNARNGVLVETTDLKEASIFFFEEVDGGHKIYTIVNDDKKYIHTKSGSQIELNSTAADTFEITQTKNKQAFYLKKNNEDKWLQHSNGGGGIRYYEKNNNTNSEIYAYFSDQTEIPEDPYSLDGLSYALMHYSGGNVGNGFYPENGSINSVEMLSWIIRTKSGDSVKPHTYYVADDVELPIWTFHYENEDNYSISTEIDGVTTYLHIDTATGAISYGEEPQPLKITPDTNNNIMISANDHFITFQRGNNNNADTFVTAQKNTDNTNQRIKLVDEADISNNDHVTYISQKVSVSDVEDGDSVIVYTRVWNDDISRYEFYAVDHDGNLYPCYERGDNIMWAGGRINTLRWDFTEYKETDGQPNYYYELFNPYSNKYIAPNRSEGTVLSDEAVGINLPGRKMGEYYTDILTWDDPSYSYSSLGSYIDGAEDSRTVAKARYDSDTFYFAKIIDPTSSLTEVETIDNDQYGIRMRMVDWKNSKLSGNAGETQSVFMGSLKNGGTKPVKGLLSTDLGSDGYPKNAVEHSTVSGHENDDVFGKSLKGLYDNADGKYGARDVNHLFIKSIYESSGYFEFDSCQNFATLIKSDSKAGNDFTVYKELGTNERDKTTSKHGQFLPYNVIKPGEYSKVNPENLYSALADYSNPAVGVLPETDPRKYESLYSVGTESQTNYYNGMELSASFTQTPNGKDNWGHDIIFEFTGDDDFWLYVDGELVIDLGGIHTALAGSVNFATGNVIVNGTEKTLRDVFIENFRARHPNASDAEIAAYLTEKNFDTVPGAAGNAPLSERFEPIFNDYSRHEMRIFYMERGAGASNLHMRFNLNYVTPGNVILKKEVSGSDDIDFEHVEYPFQILYRYKDDSTIHYLGDATDTTQNKHVYITYQNSTKKVEHVQTYTPPGGSAVYKSVFFINPLNSAEIHFPEDTYYYQIVECGINTEVYEWTRINDELPEKNPENATAPKVETVDNRNNYITSWDTVEDRPNVTYNNHVDPDGLRTLSFTKKLYDNDYRSDMSDADKQQHKLTEDDDPATFTFRLYLSNGVTDDLPLANMAKYRVLDPDGYYCTWDKDHQRFVRYKDGENNTDTIRGKSELDIRLGNIADDASLTDEQKKAAKEALLEQITFESSMNGSISKIPAWYKVEVPNLPVGTKFKVEERDADSERPLGYDLVEYEREAGTYHTDEGERPNTGTVHKNESPVMSVVNQKGFEIEAVKKWSDADSVKSHADIYTALYVGDKDQHGELTNLQLVAGSVRRLESGMTSVRHFMNSLASGKTLENYAVYEVELNAPVVDEDGKVTYTGVPKRLDDGAVTHVKAVSLLPENSSEESYKYSVGYEKGSVISHGYGEDHMNIARKDTISNQRDGGIVISLFDMALNAANKHDPLAGGVFDLKLGDNVIGSYRSDSNGRITIVYDFSADMDYTLVQRSAPEHYIGLPAPVTFKLTNTGTDSYSVTFGETPSTEWRDSTPQIEGEYLAYINVYNRQFTLKATKIEKQNDNSSETVKLRGAVFALYRETPGVGGYVKDFDPMPGYEALETDENGVIPKIDNTLRKGRYHLTEVRPPNGYKPLEHDIQFSITDNNIELRNTVPNVTLNSHEDNNVYECEIIIENEPDRQDLYFDIEKIAFIDKNIHDSDPEQKFVFKILRFEPGTADNDLTAENAMECFYATINCKDQLENGYPYEGVLPSNGKYAYDADGKKVTVRYTGSSDTYTFPTAVYSGRKTVRLDQPGIYLVSEDDSWSNTDYDFWVGSNTYQGFAGGGTASGMGRAVKMVVTSANMEYSKESKKTDRPTASFANSENEYAYLSSQAYAENTIRRSST